MAWNFLRRNEKRLLFLDGVEEEDLYAIAEFYDTDAAIIRELVAVSTVSSELVGGERHHSPFFRPGKTDAKL